MARFAELHDGTRLEFPDGTDDAVIQQTVKRMVMEGTPAQKGTGQPGLRAQGAQLPAGFRAFVNTMQGPTFGFADEIAGGVAAAADKVTGRNPGMGFGDLYGRYRDLARGASEQHQKDHPVLSVAGQVAASLPLGGAYRAAEGALPAAMGAGGLIRNAAILGAASGALGGAGAAESISEMASGAGLGALSGAATSGVVSGAGQGLRAVARNVRARGDGKSAENLAMERVATALQRDDRMVPQVSRRMTRLGDEATIADSAGKNTRDLLDTMATMPGRTADRAESLIRNRQIGRPGRIEDAAEGLSGGKRYLAEFGALAQKKADDSAPLYDKIRNVPVQANTNLSRILQRPVVQEAIAQARTNAANADSVLPDIKAGEAVPMQVWDDIKRGLDDVISQKKRGLDAGTANNAGKNTLKAALDTKRALLKELDEIVPGYKTARDAFAGPAALQDAMDDGRKVFSMPKTDLQVMLQGMSASERDAMRVGAFEALRDKIGTESGQTAVLKMWKEPNTRERLQAIFPDTRTFREFQAAVLGEGRLKMLEGVGRGSQTASRQSRQDDEGAAFLTEALGASASLKAGNPLGIVQGVRNLYGRTVMPEPVRDQIGGLLMQRGPQAQATLGDLSRFVEAEQARRAAAAARGGLLGSGFMNSLLGN